MKKFFSLLIIVLSLSAMSCVTDKEKSNVVSEYLASTTLFECKVVSLHNAQSWNDTVKFDVSVYHVFAKDVYDAQREFEQQLTDLQNTLNGVETHWTPVNIEFVQTYHYK